MEPSLAITQIPRFVAFRPGEVFQTGANNPMLVRGFSLETEEYEDLVVKFMGAERMSSVAACFEVLAALIAMQWEIPVAFPVLVEVRPEFLNTLKKNSMYSVAEQSIGLNYGTVYIPNLSNLNQDDWALYQVLYQAMVIFSFDIFIDNLDRTILKPNCKIQDSQIIIFDHELAFSFTRLLFSPPHEIWNMTSEQRNKLVGNSFLIERIRKFEIEEDQINEYIARIDEDFWTYALSLLPSEWKETASFKVNSIPRILTNIVKNRDKFVATLKEILK